MSGLEAALREARQLLAAAREVFVLTGAGLSVASGLTTFRDPGGHWRQHRPEELATPEAFAADPDLVWAWYNARRAAANAAGPNAAHEALAAFGQREGARVHCVTQNVDGLLERAGTPDVVRLHGSLFHVRCAAGCPGILRDERDPFPHPAPCPRCGALLRPAVTWFGEALDEQVVARAIRAGERADLLLLVGTSAAVTPAASFGQLVAERGGAVIEVNPSASALARFVTVALREDAALVLPRLLAP